MADTRPASHGIEPRHNCGALITACCTLTYMSYVTVGQWQQDWVTYPFIPSVPTAYF